MRERSGGLVNVFESCLDWLRGRRPARRFGNDGGPVETVRVDLVGGPAPVTFGDTGPSQPDRSAAPAAPASHSLSHPFRSPLAQQGGGLSKPWSFSQTVLLSPRRRGSSVLVWTAVGTVGALGLWAVLAPLDETIAVQGKLEPGSSTKRIDTPVPGVVEALLVKEGQRVRRGDPLVRFDLRDPRSKLAAAESIRARLTNENQIAAFTLGDSKAIAGLTDNQRRQLASQAEEFATRRQVSREELQKARATLSGARGNVATYASIANRYAGLVKVGAASEVQLLESRQRLQDAQTRVAEAEREVARLQASLINTGASTDLELRRRVEENLRQISQIDSDIRLARQQIQYGELKAPADGVVFDIEVNPGSVVAQGTGTSAGTATKPLLKIIPQDALLARVYIPNSAIGFVRPGQRAQLSIDAFRSSDFGTIPARVQRIGSDALTAEDQARELGNEAKGLYYPAVLQLQQQDVKLHRSKAPLQAGMTLTADIRLRERRFINILTGFFEDQRRNLERLR